MISIDIFLQIVIAVVALFILVSIVWNSIKIGISPMPSSRQARQAIVNAVDSKSAKVIVDLGSGWGTLAFSLAKHHKQARIIGYERSFYPWLFSVFFKYVFSVKNVRFYRQDFLIADFTYADTLCCYLFPDGMKSLEKKLMQEKNKAYSIISNTFALPSLQPTKVLNINDIYKTPIYIYHLDN